MKKIEKGEYGYRTSFKKKHLFLVAILVLFIMAQLFGRNFTEEKAVKNILTVMAVVTVLPAANLASPLVAVMKYRTPSREFYDKYSLYNEKFPMLFDMVLTTKDYVLPMDAIAVHPTGIYAYCINQKVNVQEAEKSLNEILISQRLDPNMKITKDLSTFDKRIKSLKPASDYEDDGSLDYAVRTMRSLCM